jgi:hypothetical protein
MDDLTKYKTNVENIGSQLAQYPTNMPSLIQEEYQKAYTPLLQESLGVTRDLMSDYLGSIMETTGLGPGMAGTTAYDLSPTQKMGQIGREIGYASGELNRSSRYSDYLGGQMTDMYNKAIQAAQMGQQALADQYARELQQYQMAWQEAESAKDRALQSSIAAQNRQSQIDLSKHLNQPGQTASAPSQQDLLKGIQGVANSIASQRGKTGGTYTYNGMNLGDINSAHKYIMDNARTNYNLNLNPQWLWSQLGNTANQSYKALL